MGGTDAIKDRDQKLAEQLPDDWEQANEIPDRSEDPEDEGEEMTQTERIKNKLDPDTLMVQRDENGEVIPLEVPLIMHPDDPDIDVVINPLTGSDEYELAMMQADHSEAKEEGEIIERGDYDVDAESGELRGYDGVSLEQMRRLFNEHLVEPSYDFETNQEMLDSLQENMMNALFFTVKVYGLGLSLDDDADTVTEVLEDKKK